MQTQRPITVRGRTVQAENPLPTTEPSFNIEPVQLDAATLLRRISVGDWSGLFLADAFISTYRVGKKFNWSLGEIVNLDPEAFSLLHGILHMRHVPGWSDAELYTLECDIKVLLGGAS